jgi:hypothetical protein
MKIFWVSPRVVCWPGDVQAPAISVTLLSADKELTLSTASIFGASRQVVSYGAAEGFRPPCPLTLRGDYSGLVVVGSIERCKTGAEPSDRQ